MAEYSVPCNDHPGEVAKVTADGQAKVPYFSHFTFGPKPNLQHM